MPITDLRSTNLWSLIEQKLEATDEHVCALPMRTYIKPVRVITLLQTDTAITSSEAPCPPGSKDINVPVDPEKIDPPETTEPETTPKALPVTSTFEQNDEGWRIVGDGIRVPRYFPNGGNPGGQIRGVDLVLGGTWHYRAPAKFLGNQSGAFGKIFSFRLWTSDITLQYNEADVRIWGGGLVIVRDNPRIQRAKAWQSFSMRLDSTGRWRKRSLSGAFATDDEIKRVLANMSGLHIRGEFNTGADAGSLSNVVFGADPAPTP